MLESKLVVIIGATGTGKTKLSIEVAKAIGGEVVNADKMQVYNSLDITTNKVPLQDRCGIPHHLVGSVSTHVGDFSVSFFRSIAAATVSSILKHAHTPIVVGGSNSLIHGLLAGKFDSALADPFKGSNGRYQPTLRYQCCFLWVHACESVLSEHLRHRVDTMVDIGLVKEVKEYYDEMSVAGHVRYVGLGRAIGIQELGGYFAGWSSQSTAIAEIKTNTQILGQAQLLKIHTMVNAWKWPIHSLDCTEVIRAHLFRTSKSMEDMVWKRSARSDLTAPQQTGEGALRQAAFPFPIGSVAGGGSAVAGPYRWGQSASTSWRRRHTSSSRCTLSSTPPPPSTASSSAASSMGPHPPPLSPSSTPCRSPTTRTTSRFSPRTSSRSTSSRTTSGRRASPSSATTTLTRAATTPTSTPLPSASGTTSSATSLAPPCCCWITRSWRRQSRGRVASRLFSYTLGIHQKAGVRLDQMDVVSSL